MPPTRTPDDWVPATHPNHPLTARRPNPFAPRARGVGYPAPRQRCVARKPKVTL